MTIEIKEGDALNHLLMIPDTTVDLVIADPPYNLGKDYGNSSDQRSYDDYMQFSRNWIKEAHRILKDTGSIYVFMGVRFISYIYAMLEKEFGFHFNSWITWYYTQGLGKRKGFSPRHDDILMFTKTKNFKFNLDSIRVPQKYYRSINNMRGANPGDVWEFSHVHYCNKNRKSHPTQKPEALIERMVMASSEENDLIVDPFAGSGTTLRVCQQLNRNCIGIELNPDYVVLIKNRLEESFVDFDSIDQRMLRIPNDIKNKDQYLENHKEWFLKNHPIIASNFDNNIDKKQITMFDFNEN